LKPYRPLFLSEKILDNIDHEVDLIQQRREKMREEKEEKKAKALSMAERKGEV
jgi:hypothetical protein